MNELPIAQQEPKRQGRPPTKAAEKYVPKSVTMTEAEKDREIRAKTAQEQRRSAPLISVSGQRQIPQKEIIERVSRADGGQDAKDGYHYAFYAKDTVDRQADRGYEVARFPNGKIADFSTDICMKIPTDIWLTEQMAIAKRGKEKFTRSRKRDAQRLKESGVVDSDGIQITAEKQTVDNLNL